MPLTTYVIEGRGHPERLLVLLHGYDATEHDLAALGPLIDPDGHFLVAGPRGPLDVEGGTGAAWHCYGPRGPDPDTFQASLEALDEALDHLCATHLMARDEAVIGGFSQGAATALALGLGGTDRPRPAGILCMSGFLADVEGLTYDWAAAATVPVLVQHGTRDEMVPPDLGIDTARTLAHHGAPVVLRTYDAAHQTTPESLADARDWLAAVRAGDRPTEPLD